MLQSSCTCSLKTIRLSNTVTSGDLATKIEIEGVVYLWLLWRTMSAAAPPLTAISVT